MSVSEKSSGPVNAIVKVALRKITQLVEARLKSGDRTGEGYRYQTLLVYGILLAWPVLGLAIFSLLQAIIMPTARPWEFLIKANGWYAALLPLALALILQPIQMMMREPCMAQDFRQTFVWKIVRDERNAWRLLVCMMLMALLLFCSGRVLNSRPTRFSRAFDVAMIYAYAGYIPEANEIADSLARIELLTEAQERQLPWIGMAGQIVQSNFAVEDDVPFWENLQQQLSRSVRISTASNQSWPRAFKKSLLDKLCSRTDAIPEFSLDFHANLLSAQVTMGLARAHGIPTADVASRVRSRLAAARLAARGDLAKEVLLDLKDIQLLMLADQDPKYAVWMQLLDVREKRWLDLDSLSTSATVFADQMEEMPSGGMAGFAPGLLTALDDLNRRVPRDYPLPDLLWDFQVTRAWIASCQRDYPLAVANAGLADSRPPIIMRPHTRGVLGTYQYKLASSVQAASPNDRDARFKEAEQSLAQALDANPRIIINHRRRMLCYLTWNKPGQALLAAENALAHLDLRSDLSGELRWQLKQEFMLLQTLALAMQADALRSSDVQHSERLFSAACLRGLAALGSPDGVVLANTCLLDSEQQLLSRRAGLLRLVVDEMGSHGLRISSTYSEMLSKICDRLETKPPPAKPRMHRSKPSPARSECPPSCINPVQPEVQCHRSDAAQPGPNQHSSPSK